MVDDLLLKALAAHARGDAAGAEGDYRALLRAEPGDRTAARFLGMLLAHREELAEAVAGLARDGDALESRPGDAPYQEALALRAMERPDEALTACRAALARDPDHAPALVLLAVLLRVRGQLDEAVSAARRAVQLAPTATAHGELGLALFRQERVIEAATAFQRAIALAPNDAQAHANLGNLLLETGELEQAVARFERALELEPGSPGVHNNIGVAALGMGRFRAAARALQRAQDDAPGVVRFRYNMAFALLGEGDLARGWEVFDHGFEAGGRTPDRTFPVPRWDGRTQPDATLMVWREQGVGDELRLASCYAEAGARVGGLIIECDPRLTGLLARSFPAATVRAQFTGPEPPDFSLHCPAGSLPRHLRARLEDFPGHKGYLVPDPVLVERWRARLDALPPAALRVGIAWRSMNLSVGRLSHYTTLPEWGPVLGVPDVTFVNLQYGREDLRAEELAATRDATGVTVHAWDDVDYTDDFEQMAALTQAVDLVIGVGTTPALLAGALGRPVWMLALPDPLALGTAGYPWFPSMRRFERPWNASWEAPMRVVAGELTRLARA